MGWVGTRRASLAAAVAAAAAVLILAGCGGSKENRAGAGAGGKSSATSTSSGQIEGSEGGGATSSGVDTGLVLRGEGVGVCVGFESGDVLNSDGEGNANGQFFWDPLDREHEVQDQGLGGISAYDNKVALYFWPSADKARQVYADARAKHVHDVQRIGNAVVVGMGSLDPSARSVVNDCLTSNG